MINFKIHNFEVNNFEVFIATRYLLARIRQSLIIVFAVSIGVAIIIWVPSINIAFFNDLIDKSVSSAPHITITRNITTFDRNVNVLKKELKENLLLDDQTLKRKRNILSEEAILSKIKDIKGILAAVPYVEGQAFVIRGGEEAGVAIKGIIPKREVEITDIENDIIQGQIKDMGINDIVVGNKLADKLHVDLHDRISVTGPRGDTKSLKIVGIFSTGLVGKDEGQVYVNLKSGQTILDLDNTISGVGLKISNIYQAENLADVISKKTGLSVGNWMANNRQILDSLNRFKLIIAFINFLIIFSAASSITSIFILMVTSKAKEIGILKSMGAKKASIMNIFIIQALTLSTSGFVLGLIMAKIMLLGYQNIINYSQGLILVSSLPNFTINKTYALLAFVYSILTSFIASFLPAYKAATLNPVEAING